jgi:excisionase family DNA binding protein
MTVNGTEHDITHYDIGDNGADPGQWLSLREAAQRLNKTERFIRRLVRERRIRYYKHGHFLAFRKADLDTWATSDCREAAQ